MTTALIAGASGLVGGLLLQHLLADARYEQVVSLGRRKLDVDHPKLRQESVDFGALDKLAPFPVCDDVFSCLGTTIKKAGSKEAFYAVDHDAVIAVGKAARAAGAKQMLHVSSLGADAGSMIFYNRVKGETERDVAAIGFDAAVAFQPSIIDGERAESRTGERIGLAVTRLFAPVLGKYKPTSADAIARAMIAVAKEKRSGSFVVDSREIERLA
ncbi:MAG: NAD(P)H-binding protein [Polyangiaceae bacterium]|nr:NAD(P)H-binding protein [Polyangiaceae bacterium]